LKITQKIIYHKLLKKIMPISCANLILHPVLTVT